MKDENKKITKGYIKVAGLDGFFINETSYGTMPKRYNPLDDPNDPIPRSRFEYRRSLFQDEVNKIPNVEPIKISIWVKIKRFFGKGK